MGRENILFKSEETKSLADVAAFLRKMADKIESGALTFRRGEESVDLSLPASVAFEIKVEEEERAGRPAKRSLEIEMEWVAGETPGTVELD